MTSDKTLKQAISNITIWRKGEQRAPHKPLLLLYVLSHYRQGHGRMFNYGSEIYEPLLDLLERYGPQRRDQRPDMPFWRLKGDGFWELHNAELCSTSGSRQPPRRELIEYNVAGGFDADNFALVAKNHRLIDTLAQQLLEAHFRPVFRKRSLTRWVLIFAPLSVNAIRSFARWCYVLTIISALSAALTCATTMRRLLWKPLISDGSSTMALAKYLMAWHCVQSTIKRLIAVRLAWMKICVWWFPVR